MGTSPTHTRECSGYEIETHSWFWYERSDWFHTVPLSVSDLSQMDTYIVANESETISVVDDIM